MTNIDGYSMIPAWNQLIGPQPHDAAVHDAPADGDAVDGQCEVGSKRPEAAAHLVTRAEETSDSGYGAAPAFTPATPPAPCGFVSFLFSRVRAGSQQHPITLGGV